MIEGGAWRVVKEGKKYFGRLAYLYSHPLPARGGSSSSRRGRDNLTRSTCVDNQSMSALSSSRFLSVEVLNNFSHLSSKYVNLNVGVLFLPPLPGGRNSEPSNAGKVSSRKEVSFLNARLSGERNNPPG